MNKSIHHVLFGLLLSAGVATVSAQSFPTPPANSPYKTDVQSSYAQDPAQDTFSEVSMIGCMIRSMLPEQNIGVGPYVAIVDQNKCDTSASSQSGGSSDSSSSTQARNVTAVLNVTLNTDKSLNVVGSLAIPADPNSGDSTDKNIQIHATVNGGPSVFPPYGKWEMHFCSSSSPSYGKCDDGKGYVSVTEKGISLYMGGGADGFKAGTAIWSNVGASAGYGRLLQTNGAGQSITGKFAYANSLYRFDQTAPASNSMCFDPSLSNAAARYSVWQNFLYEQATGQKVAYTNPGFYISAPGSSRQIGQASYDGVQFWSNNSAADLNATSVNGPDGTNYTVKRSPGTLRSITTSTGTMDMLDGVLVNYGFWGQGPAPSYTRVSTTSYIKANCSETACNTLDANNTNVNLIGVYSKATTSFTFTGFVDYSQGGKVSNFNTPLTKLFSDITTANVDNINGWVNGANLSYNVSARRWVGSPTNAVVAYAPTAALVTLRKSTNLSPNDVANGLALNCIGNCPVVSGGKVTADTYSASTPVALAWNQTLAAVTRSGVAIDWRSTTTTNPNKQSHYYELFTDAQKTAMACGVSGTNYCTGQVTNPAVGQTSTYYSWQSGAPWDAYTSLVNTSTGQPPAIDPPVTLSYKVPDANGNPRSMVGQTISIQSPSPGSIWLPGHCVDFDGKQTQCDSNSKWINDVFIPYAQDATGTVGKLNSSGAASGTSYYVKWLNRGVFYKPLSPSACSGLDITAAGSATLPTVSNVESTIAAQPWPADSAFQATPRVKDGVMQ